MPRGDMELTPEMRAKYVVRMEPEKLEQAIAEEIHQAVRELLSRLGTSGFCNTCQRAIYWVFTTNGRRRVPYSTRGVPHTDDCDMAGRPGVKLGRWQSDLYGKLPQESRDRVEARVKKTLEP